MQQASTTYPSKVDAWIALLVGGACVTVVGLGLMAFLDGHAEGAWLLLAALLLVAFLRVVAWPVYYTLAEEFFVTRVGVLSFHIPYGDIDTVLPSRNPVSSPAWSLDRLRVDFRRKNGKRTFLLISPEDKTEFARLLADRAKLREEDGAYRREPKGESP